MSDLRTSLQTELSSFQADPSFGQLLEAAVSRAQAGGLDAGNIAGLLQAVATPPPGAEAVPEAVSQLALRILHEKYQQTIGPADPAVALARSAALHADAPTYTVPSHVTAVVWKIEVKPGQKVAAGTPLMVLESMKMEIPVYANKDGVVVALLVNEGDSVAEKQDVVHMRDLLPGEVLDDPAEGEEVEEVAAAPVPEPEPLDPLLGLYLPEVDLNLRPTAEINPGFLNYVIVADKGEMGVRAVKEALALGKIPVVIYNSDDDADSWQVRLATSHGGIAIGLQGTFKETYASYRAIASAVVTTFQQKFGEAWRDKISHSALYPGYGPLAENSAAIEYFRQYGIAFIGPTQQSVDQVGDKRRFRTLVSEFDTKAVTPGIIIDSNNPGEIYNLITAAYNKGDFILPGRLKAANGGGGRGQVVISSLEELKGAIKTVLGAIAANGWQAGVMFEQNIPETTHLEVQVIRDQHGNTRIIGMRDCTEQRASQKVQEEAPPAILKKYTELQPWIAKIVASTVDRVGYTGAGTFELMFKNGKVYFLEMNTRIQVEHPVSEESYGIDRGDGTIQPLNLVAWQMKIADGEPIDFTQEQIVKTHVSREFRINAEAWDSNIEDVRDKKKGMFAPNSGIFDEITVPTPAEIMAILVIRGVEGIENLKIRFDSGFEAGDLLVRKDPTFAKLIVSVAAKPGHEDREYELLRLASMAVLEKMNIRGRQATSAADISDKPFKTNIADHVRILKSKTMRNHARGVFEGRHVNWVVSAFREGEDLDASPYPPLIRQSEESRLKAPVVYAIHRDDPTVVNVKTPAVLANPGAYSGLLARYLESLRRKNVPLHKVFGTQVSNQHRAGMALDGNGKILYAVLFRREAPMSVLFTLESLDIPVVLKIDLHYHIDSITLHIENLTQGGTVDFLLHRGLNGAFHPEHPFVVIPGIGQEFKFSMEMSDEQKLLTVSNVQGDRIISIRPHMAKGLVARYNELIQRLGNQTLTHKAGEEIQGQLRQVFVDMAITGGRQTETRTRLLRSLARSPHNLTTEITLMTLYKSPDNRPLQDLVRNFAAEALFYRYYESRFHHVTGYERERLRKEQINIIFGTFNDDPQAGLPYPKSEGRHVALGKVRLFSEEASPAQIEGEIRKVLTGAMRMLRNRNKEDRSLEHDVIEIMLTQHEEDDAFSATLAALVNEVLGENRLRRVTFMVYEKKGDSKFVPGTGFFTYRPTGSGETLYEESTKYDDRFGIVPRHEHPMVSEQMERWRWGKFDSKHVPSLHRRVHITDVTAIDNPSDKRFVLDAQVRERVVIVDLDGKLLEKYIRAHLNGGSIPEALADSSAAPEAVPDDLEVRLQNVFKWRLFKKGVISDPVTVDLQALYKKGVVTDSLISNICKEVDGTPYYSSAIEWSLKKLAAELRRMVDADKAGTHNDNRVELFIQEPVALTPDLVAFIGYHFYPLFRADRLEKMTVHYLEPAINGYQSRILSLKGNPSDTDFARFVDETVALVQPKNTYEMDLSRLHDLGNLAPAEKATLLFDDGVFLELRVADDGSLVEAPFNPTPNKGQSVRGFVGMVGGRRTYFICVDPLNMRKGQSFDAPDGEYIAAFIERTYGERDEEGNIVGAPIIKSEEFSSGATLYNSDPNWAGTHPLDSFGREFEARYTHARTSGRPNITVINTLVVGGGIYGPKASHDVITARGLAVAALTGGVAAAYAKGALPKLLADGKTVVPEGGGERFDEMVSGSADVHGANGVFTTVVTTARADAIFEEKVMALVWDDAFDLKTKPVDNDDERKAKEKKKERIRKAEIEALRELSTLLSPEEKVDLQEESIRRARESVLFLDDNLKALLPKRGANLNLDIDLSRAIPKLGEYLNEDIFEAFAKNDISIVSGKKPILEAMIRAIDAGDEATYAANLAKLNPEGGSHPDAGLFTASQTKTMGQMKPLLLTKYEKPTSAPSFVPVLEAMAVRDAQGKPLVKVWGEKWAPDLLTAWVALPIQQEDGTIKVESVAFMMNDPSGAKRGAITPEACRKAEQFLEINSRLGRAMIRFAGSPGFLANHDAEATGIEQLGKRAMDQVIAYRGPMYTLEIFEDDGGARIFMGSVTLGRDGHIVTDAVDHPRVRLAPLPTKATAGIMGKGRVKKAVDQARDEGVPKGKLKGVVADTFHAFAAETVESGTAQRAKSAGAIRNVIDPNDVLANISSGILQARRQMKEYEATEKQLRDRGIRYVTEGQGEKRVYQLEGGRVLRPAELREFIDSIQRAEALARVLGKTPVITVTGDVLVDGAAFLAGGILVDAVAAVERAVALILESARSPSSQPSPLEGEGRVRGPIGEVPTEESVAAFLGWQRAGEEDHRRAIGEARALRHPMREGTYYKDADGHVFYFRPISQATKPLHLEIGQLLPELDDAQRLTPDLAQQQIALPILRSFPIIGVLRLTYFVPGDSLQDHLRWSRKRDGSIGPVEIDNEGTQNKAKFRELAQFMAGLGFSPIDGAGWVVPEFLLNEKLVRVFVSDRVMKISILEGEDITPEEMMAAFRGWGLGGGLPEAYRNVGTIVVKSSHGERLESIELFALKITETGLVQVEPGSEGGGGGVAGGGPGPVERVLAAPASIPSPPVGEPVVSLPNQGKGEGGTQGPKASAGGDAVIWGGAHMMGDGLPDPSETMEKGFIEVVEGNTVRLVPVDAALSSSKGPAQSQSTSPAKKRPVLRLVGSEPAKAGIRLVSGEAPEDEDAKATKGGKPVPGKGKQGPKGLPMAKGVSTGVQGLPRNVILLRR